MFLDYLALVVILIVLVAIFYLFIYIHDLPHKIAHERNHPHTEAIHVATWLSLFTLPAIWPLVFIWAISKPKPGAGTHGGHTPEGAPTGASLPKPKPGEGAAGEKGGTDSDLARRLLVLEERLSKLEGDAK